MSGLTFQGNEV